MKNSIVVKWFALCFYKLNKHINFLVGGLAGLISGSIVFFINFGHGFYPALASLFKQFAFNLIMGGFNVRWCEKIIRGIKKRKCAILFGTLIPTVTAFVMLYAVHYFGRTPKPGASTFWQFGLNLIIFFFMSVLYRNLFEKDIDSKTLNRRTVAAIRRQGLMKVSYRKNVG